MASIAGSIPARHNKFMNKKMKIKIGKAAREALEALPQSERAGIMKEFMASVQDGTLFEKSEPVDMAKMKKEEPKLYARLQKALKELPKSNG